MKNRLVIWGVTEKEERVLLLFELFEGENKVVLDILPHAEVTEEFYQKLMDDWRKGKDVELPENRTTRELGVQLGESILPDDLKTKQTDLVTKTQAEWQFFVASHKLYELYKQETEDLKEKIEESGKYKEPIWQELKSFWSKVQNQIRDRNLFGVHIDDLRKRVDGLFDDMKKLRKNRDEMLKEASKPVYENIQAKLDKVQGKIEEGLSLKPIFEELKKIQREFKNEKLQRDYQNKLWNRIDGMFKAVKKKRFGDSPTGNDKLTRLERRLQGLEKVIHNMESSIEHERKNLFYEKKRKDNSSNQLESQLREAKLMMIEERLNSKESKLKDILGTKTSILSQIEKAKEDKKKQEEAQKIEAAKVEAKNRIKQQMEEQSQAVDDSEIIKAVHIASGTETTESSEPSVETPEKKELEVKSTADEVSDDPETSGEKNEENSEINISVAGQVAASISHILEEE